MPINQVLWAFVCDHCRTKIVARWKIKMRDMDIDPYLPSDVAVKILVFIVAVYAIHKSKIVIKIDPENGIVQPLMKDAIELNIKFLARFQKMYFLAVTVEEFNGEQFCLITIV